MGPSTQALVATVERVSDGDTVAAISENGTKLRIRLLGIDAPEIAHGTKPGQPYGEEARDYFDRLIGGKTVPVDGSAKLRERELGREVSARIRLLRIAGGNTQ